MGLKVCKDCGTEVSTNAKSCPKCGRVLKQKIYKKWWFWVIIVFLFIVGATNSSEKTEIIYINVDTGSEIEIKEEPLYEEIEPKEIVQTETIDEVEDIEQDEPKKETTKKGVTKENYEKIQNGMTEEEVENILGSPSSTSENEISDYGKTVYKHYQEFLSLKAIDVYFLDGKVYMKNWTEL